MGATEASSLDLARDHEFFFTPITYEYYFNVQVLGMSIGGSPISVASCTIYNENCFNAMVDTGYTVTVVPKVAYNAIINALTLILLADEDFKRYLDAEDLIDFFAGKYAFIFSDATLAKLPIITITLPGISSPDGTLTEFDLSMTPLEYMIVQPRYDISNNLVSFLEKQPLRSFGFDASDCGGTIIGMING